MNNFKNESLQKKLVDKFNKVLNLMLNHIMKYHRNDDIDKVRSIIDQYIISYPEEPISNFLIHVYRNDTYRECILNGNDDFFMESENIENHQEGIFSYLDKEQYIRKLFEFKNIWSTLDSPTKNFIKKSMLCLVKISEKYILSI